MNIQLIFQINKYKLNLKLYYSLFQKHVFPCIPQFYSSRVSGKSGVVMRLTNQAWGSNEAHQLGLIILARQ